MDYKRSNRFLTNIRRDFERTDIERYGRINYIRENGNESYTISISLISEYMYRADAHFFMQIARNNRLDIPIYDDDILLEEEFEGYRPYIYEFVSNASYLSYNFWNSENHNRWFPIYISEHKESEADNSIVGTILFSASPLVAKGKQLVFEFDKKHSGLCDKLNRLYTASNLYQITQKCINNSSVLTDFDGMLPCDINEVDGTVYSVGLANAIHLNVRNQNKQECQIIYDIGKTHISSVLNRPIIAANTRNFKNAKFDAVVLSHWDSDHIIGVGDYNPRLLYSSNMIWIAPDINLLTYEELSLAAVRLACFVSQRCKLYLSNNLNSNVFVHSNAFEIWQGCGCKNGTASHQNNIGLLIKSSGYLAYCMVNSSIGNRNVLTGPARKNTKLIPYNTLLCGDCVYDNFPAAIRDEKCDLICIPHHGTDKALPGLKPVIGGIAMISADDSGTSTDYPGQNHVYELLKLGYRHFYVTKQSGNINFFISYL